MNPSTTSNDSSLLSKLLHEPTVHFLLVASLIFAVYAALQADNENLLEVSQREIDARIFMQELAQGEELSLEQRELLTAFFIEEQILVKEALAMELDNDARIHDILAQKMRHVLSGNIIQPTPEELQAYFDANASRFESPASIDLDELVFNSRETLDESVLAELEMGAEPERLLALEEGTVAPLPNVNAVDLANIFDQAFADTVLAGELNQWQGPYISNRGQHWLRIINESPAAIPRLEDISDLVRLEWIAAEEEARLQAEIDRLWEQYTIVITQEESE